MIIPGNALRALLSPPQESQSTREDEGGFGALLTEIEQHTTPLSDQEEAERRALDSVLQVLMSMFQSCTPANGLPAASAPGTGESDLVSMRPLGGLPLKLSPDRVTTPALWDTGAGNLPLSMVSDGAQDMRQLAFPALDSQSTGAAPAAAGAPENFSWLLHRQDSTQDLSGLFMAQPTVALTVSTPTDELGTPSGAPLPTTPSFARDSVLVTAEVQYGSPGLLQTSLTTTGERYGAVQETLPPAPAAPWAVPATAPLAEAAVAFLTVPQTGGDAVSAALRPRTLAPEDAALLESDPSPASRPLAKSQERAAATVPSVAPLATDSGLSLGSARATSHIPSTEPPMTVPLRYSLEDVGHPWPRPVPANTVVLHLEPRELGALLLQVRINDKHLIASFQAQSPEAETLLRAHLPSLHESLSQHGFEVQPIAISLAAEGFNAHMGAGTGAFAHQHSAFQTFAQDQQAARSREMQNEVEMHRTPRRPAEQRPRLLDVVI